MMKYLTPLPLILAAALLALFSSALLGQTRLLSALFGADYLGGAAESALFFLTLIYALILLLLRRFCRRRLFSFMLWGLNAALLLRLGAVFIFG